MNFGIGLSIFAKKPVEILIGIVLTVYHFEEYYHFNHLKSSIHECGMSFHLFKNRSFISFNNVYSFLSVSFILFLLNLFLSVLVMLL